MPSCPSADEKRQEGSGLPRHMAPCPRSPLAEEHPGDPGVPPRLLASHPGHRHGMGPWASVGVRWEEGALLLRGIVPQFPP